MSSTPELKPSVAGLMEGSTQQLASLRNEVQALMAQIIQQLAKILQEIASALKSIQIDEANKGADATRDGAYGEIASGVTSGAGEIAGGVHSALRGSSTEMKNIQKESDNVDKWQKANENPNQAKFALENGEVATPRPIAEEAAIELTETRDVRPGAVSKAKKTDPDANAIKAAKDRLQGKNFAKTEPNVDDINDMETLEKFDPDAHKDFKERLDKASDRVEKANSTYSANTNKVVNQLSTWGTHIAAPLSKAVLMTEQAKDQAAQGQEKAAETGVQQVLDQMGKINDQMNQAQSSTREQVTKTYQDNQSYINIKG